MNLLYISSIMYSIHKNFPAETFYRINNYTIFYDYTLFYDFKWLKKNKEVV